MLYDIMYEFISSSIFANHYLSAEMTEWLSNTTCIIIMCLFVVCLIKLVVWTFKTISRGFVRL